MKLSNEASDFLKQNTSGSIKDLPPEITDFFQKTVRIFEEERKKQGKNTDGLMTVSEQ